MQLHDWMVTYAAGLAFWLLVVPPLAMAYVVVMMTGVALFRQEFRDWRDNRESKRERK